MTAINFPDSPSNGDTHVVGGVTYTYNSAETKWKTTINSNAFLPLSGGTLSGNLTLGSNQLTAGGLTYPTSDGTTGQYLQTDGSGTLSFATVASLSNAEDGTGTNFEFNSGFGSNGVAYGVRAWITFSGAADTIGTGRESGNMDAVTDNATGDYTLNFTNDMPDANYCLLASIANTYNEYSNIVSSGTRAVGTVVVNGTTAPTTGAIRINSYYGASSTNNGGSGDFEIFAAIIR